MSASGQLYKFLIRIRKVILNYPVITYDHLNLIPFSQKSKENFTQRSNPPKSLAYLIVNL